MWLFRPVIFIFFAITSSVSSYTQENFELLTEGIETYLRTGYETRFLPQAFQNYQLTSLFRQVPERIFNNSHLCFLCNLVAKLMIFKRKVGASREFLAKEVEFLCVHLGIESERVCSGVIDINLDVFLYIVDNHPNLTSDRVCGTIFQSLGCSRGDVYDWSVTLPSRESIERNQPRSSNTFKIVQLSDIHFDPNYKPNGNADCGEPICCQTDQGEPKSSVSSCGYWSDYRDADVPWHLVEEATRQIKTQKFDYLYYTGDVISHRVWDTSLSNNSWAVSHLFSFFEENFDVPVYPIFGNHEPHPLNVWSHQSITDERFSLKWLFEIAADSWSKLVGEDIKETVLKGGYYTVTPKPGFRIIAINSNLCYTYNWWLIYDDVDPYAQLKWLAYTLKKAEDNNERVHILSHVPTGSSECLSIWGREYSRIVERFSNTITGQFNGHTHRDEFYVYYSSSAPEQSVGVAFNGASLTPYTLSNPSYKIFEVDSSTFSLKDYEEWTFNLTLANTQPSQQPQWYKLYSFVEAYGVENLDHGEVDKVLYKMAENHILLDNYFKFKFRNSDAATGGGCDESCQKNNLCEIATTVYGVDTHCNRFLSLYNK